LDGSSSSGGPEYLYTWTNSAGQVIYSGNNPYVSVNQPGSYSLNVVNLDNGCEEDDLVEVTRDVTPPVANAGADQELNCVAPQVMLDGSSSSAGPEFTYEWQVAFLQEPYATATLVQTDQPGLYTLVVTNIDNGCTASDQVFVDLNTNRPTDATMAVDGPTCFGDQDGSIVVQEIIGGQSPFLYNVNGAGFVSQSAFPQLGAGVYEIVVQDATGCEYETVVTIPEGNDLVLDLGEDQYIDLGEDAGLQATINIDPSQVVQFQWGDNEFFDCLDCFEQQITPFQTVTFSGTLVDINGCTTTDRVTVYVDKTRNIFVPSAFSPNGDGINDRLMVFADQDVAVVKSFLVFNRWGETVFEVYNFQPNDPAYGWDGNFRSRPYNANVLVWYVEVEFIDGEVVLFKGDVTLMR
ncbi:MAG: gliding motility-associated C-terminal domain-containing protein, partial [Saprospiraceae bacterium]|nr:gliding motility-associated C-terminal domain-containing protein [Saprospiraceae bacterium]